MVDAGSSDEAALWRWVSEYAERYRASLRDRTVAAPADTQTIAQKLSELTSLPQQGLSALACIQELVALAEPGITAMSGPRFAGWVVGGTLPAALAADWLTSTWDQNAGVVPLPAVKFPVGKGPKKWCRKESERLGGDIDQHM